MSAAGLVQAAQWVFLLYFALLNLAYLGLNLVALARVRTAMGERALGHLPLLYAGFEPPISILVPAYNEAATIAASVRSLLQLEYGEFEIIVVNDGSRDDTLAVLQKAFVLAPFPEVPWRRLATAQVKGTYRSTLHPNLRVVDKENGGKADALNAGINASRYPLFCAVDADSVLQRDSLRKVVQPFLEDPDVVAAGGTIRIANGCRVSGGFLTHVGLPRQPLALIQIVEYLRAFLFGRLGWMPLNAVLIISGAFGLFRKEAVVEAGGYRTDTVGEDMELIVRLHRLYRSAGRAYRIVFLPDPICWTEAPESLRVLGHQRMRWQRGLAESLTMNRGLLLHRRGGAAGWLAFPFMLIFEWWGPLIEVMGYAFFVAAFAAGLVSAQAFLAFLMVAVGFGVLLSASALFLEEISFRLYPRASQLLALAGVVLAENLGYRQLNAWWRLRGLVQWLFKKRARWGRMVRRGAWQREE